MMFKTRTTQIVLVVAICAIAGCAPYKSELMMKHKSQMNKEAASDMIVSFIRMQIGPGKISLSGPGYIESVSSIDQLNVGIFKLTGWGEVSRTPLPYNSWLVRQSDIYMHFNFAEIFRVRFWHTRSLDRSRVPAQLDLKPPITMVEITSRNKGLSMRFEKDQQMLDKFLAAINVLSPGANIIHVF